jgi:hypothetical protein
MRRMVYPGVTADGQRLQVRDPGNSYRPLPDDGLEVEWGHYWQRALDMGDISIEGPVAVRSKRERNQAPDEIAHGSRDARDTRQSPGPSDSTIKGHDVPRDTARGGVGTDQPVRGRR